MQKEGKHIAGDTDGGGERPKSIDSAGAVRSIEEADVGMRRCGLIVYP